MNTSLAIKAFVVLSGIMGLLYMLLGVSTLTATEIPPGIFDAADFVAGLGVVWSISYAIVTYRALVHARDHDDPRVERPALWLLASLVTYLNFYMSFAIFPRIVPAWLSDETGIAVSGNEVKAATATIALCSLALNRLSSTEYYELIGALLALTGVAALAIAWRLRRTLSEAR